MREYHFHLSSFSFEAEVVLVGEWTLLDLGDTLLKAVHFDPIFGFAFASDYENPHLSKELFLTRMDLRQQPRPNPACDLVPIAKGVKGIPVSDVFAKGRVMLFTPDLQDPSPFLVACTDIREVADAPACRKVVSRSGPIPPQKVAHPLPPLTEEDFFPASLGETPETGFAPTKAYHFTLKYGDFQAKVVLTGEWSLANLAEVLLVALKFECDHIYEFCDNLKNPYRSVERYTLEGAAYEDLYGDDEDEEDSDPPATVEKTPVAEVFWPKRKLLFHFDFGDDWMFPVTCTAIKEAKTVECSIVVVETKGTPPVQYPDCEE